VPSAGRAHRSDLKTACIVTYFFRVALSSQSVYVALTYIPFLTVASWLGVSGLCVWSLCVYVCRSSVRAVIYILSRVHTHTALVSSPDRA